MSDLRVNHIRGLQEDIRVRENMEVEDGGLYYDAGSQQAGKFEIMKSGTEQLFVVSVSLLSEKDFVVEQ